jgi:hypothetical protein
LLDKQSFSYPGFALSSAAESRLGWRREAARKLRVDPDGGRLQKSHNFFVGDEAVRSKIPKSRSRSRSSSRGTTIVSAAAAAATSLVQLPKEETSRHYVQVVGPPGLGAIGASHHRLTAAGPAGTAQTPISSPRSKANPQRHCDSRVDQSYRGSRER